MGYFYGLLLKCTQSFDDIAQFSVGSNVLLKFERGNLCNTGADGELWFKKRCRSFLKLSMTSLVPNF